MSQESSAQTPIELCVIEGDGIGREVIPAAVEVLKLVAPDVIIRPMEAGWGYFQKHKTPLPDETIQVARECKAILFGAVSSPAYPVEGYFSPIVRLRRTLQAFANLRPAQHLPVPTSREGVDMLIVRELKRPFLHLILCCHYTLVGCAFILGPQ